MFPVGCWASDAGQPLFLQATKAAARSSGLNLLAKAAVAAVGQVAAAAGAPSAVPEAEGAVAAAAVAGEAAAAASMQTGMGPDVEMVAAPPPPTAMPMPGSSSVPSTHWGSCTGACGCPAAATQGYLRQLSVNGQGRMNVCPNLYY